MQTPRFFSSFRQAALMAALAFATLTACGCSSTATGEQTSSSGAAADGGSSGDPDGLEGDEGAAAEGTGGVEQGEGPEGAPSGEGAEGPEGASEGQEGDATPDGGEGQEGAEGGEGHEGDAGTAGGGAPDGGEPEAGTITAGGVSIAFDAATCAFAIRDASGTEITRMRDGAASPFNRAAYAAALHYNRDTYYDPTFEKPYFDPAAFEWYTATQAVEVTAANGALEATCATANPYGGAGEDITIRLEAGEHSAIARLTFPKGKEMVFASLNLALDDGEALFGTGENFDRLDNRGIVREMQIAFEGRSESSTNEVHVPVPFVISSKRYGVFAKERAVGAVDCGKGEPGTLRFTFASNETEYHFFANPDPLAMVENYAAITGLPMKVPFWALAPQWWRNENKNAAELLDDVARARALDIPSTVVWIDRPWSSYYHNFKFNPAQFPDPEALFDELHAQGHRVLLHHSPQLNPPGQSDLGANEENEGLYQEFKDNGWLVRSQDGAIFQFPWGGGTGAFIDFTNAAAVARVQELIARVGSLGAIGFKMDWDEYLQPNVGAVRLGFKFSNGESINTMKGYYSALYHRTMREGIEAPLGEGSFHVNRAGVWGDQVDNPCIWPGDLDRDFSAHSRGPTPGQEQWNVGGLPSAYFANLTTGMVGFPCFASDTGGYRGGLPEPEVLVRWFEFSVFNAVMQIGGGGSSHMPWTADSIYGPEILDIARKYMRLRMDLAPYIYHHLSHAARTGRPLVRSMWFAYPDDPALAAVEDQFMFGPDILAAPVMAAGVTERAVVLPPGMWYDYFTGEAVAGGQTVTRSAALDQIPVFLREGAMVPLADGTIDTLWQASTPGVVSFGATPHMRIRLLPAETETPLTLWNGLAVVQSRSGNLVNIEVSRTASDPAEPAAISAAPETLTLEVQNAFFTRGGLTDVNGQQLPDCPFDGPCADHETGYVRFSIPVPPAGEVASIQMH